MGAWGTGLYDNDTAADLRDGLRDVIAAPWDGARLCAWALATYPDAARPESEDHPDILLALADQFWSYGIDHPETFTLARRIIADGVDHASKTALGMAEKDLAKRAKALDELARKWAAPNPKPKPRRILAKPEPFVLGVGDCLAYPVSQGRTRNPYVGPRAAASYYALYKWAPDGWGAAVVLAQYRRHEVFARYLVAKLEPITEKPAGPERFRAGVIAAERDLINPVMHAIHAVSTNKRHLKAMEVETMGSVPIDTEAVTRDFPADGPPMSLDRTNFANHAGYGARAEEAGIPLTRYLAR